MTLIAKDTDYAIRALCFLARNDGDPISVAEISEELQISYAFLRKIMQSLHKKGILTASKGKGGGFSLNQPAEQISLLDVIQVFQGSLSLKNCQIKQKPCPEIGACRLHKELESIEHYAHRTLGALTIKDLLV